MSLTSDQRLDMLRQVYRAVAGGAGSFEHDDMVGPDLAYLLGAILNDTGCAWPEGRPILAILRACLSEGHLVYRFIQVDPE